MCQSVTPGRVMSVRSEGPAGEGEAGVRPVTSPRREGRTTVDGPPDRRTDPWACAPFARPDRTPPRRTSGRRPPAEAAVPDRPTVAWSRSPPRAGRSGPGCGPWRSVTAWCPCRSPTAAGTPPGATGRPTAAPDVPPTGPRRRAVRPPRPHRARRVRRPPREGRPGPGRRPETGLLLPEDPVRPASGRRPRLPPPGDARPDRPDRPRPGSARSGPRPPPPRTPRQMRWTNTMIKVLSPQLHVGVRPAPGRFRGAPARPSVPRYRRFRPHGTPAA